MQGFTFIDLIILIVYLAAVLIAGLFFAKKDMKGKEYFKGDGTIPWWVTSVSIFATLLSPISFLSLAGNSFAGTWIMWFAQLGMLILACVCKIRHRYRLPLFRASLWLKSAKDLRRANVHRIPNRTDVDHYVFTLYGSRFFDEHQCKYTHYPHGSDRNHLLLYWRFKIRLVDRLHSRICLDCRHYLCLDLSHEQY